MPKLASDDPGPHDYVNPSTTSTRPHLYLSSPHSPAQRQLASGTAPSTAHSTNSSSTPTAMGADGSSNLVPDAGGAVVPPPLAPRSRGRKRKQQPVSHTERDVSPSVPAIGKKARKTAAPAQETLPVHVDDSKKAKPKAKAKAKPEAPEEKRLRRFRAQPPQAFSKIEERALTQRMFVIDRSRAGSEECPEENIDIAGSTGNVYTVNISKSPSCTCPYNKKGHQCKHIAYVLIRTLKAPRHLQYQLAFVSSELRKIFAKAPPIPSEVAGDEDNDGRRKPIEDDCPICCCEFEPGNEEIVYCKAACGNNIHKACFGRWAATKPGKVTCPFCRTPWQESDEDSAKKVAKKGKVNAEGYVNVADQLDMSRERDYSTYHDYWVRREARAGRIGDEWLHFGREWD